VAFSETRRFSTEATVAFLLADIFLLLPQRGFLGSACFLFYANSGLFELLYL
jgi:hypothetical protein